MVSTAKQAKGVITPHLLSCVSASFRESPLRLSPKVMLANLSPYFLWGFFICQLMLVQLVVHSEPQIQTIPLNRGWNLISIQVGPTNSGFAPAEIQANITDERGTPTNSLISLWNVEHATNVWHTFQATNPAFPDDAGPIIPGQGFWVQVSQPGFLRLTNEPWNGAVTLRPGWNLVGFPGVRVDSAGLGLESVFRNHFPNIQQVWTFDSSPSGSKYLGFDLSGRQPLRELTTIEPGRAYWVYSLAATNLVLSNAPTIALPPDVDNPPLQSVGPGGGLPDVGSGDTDLNENHLLDDPFTQDTLYFPAGIDSRLVTIRNEGAGRLNWWASATVGNGRFVRFAVANAEVDTRAISPDLISVQAGRTRSVVTNLTSGSVAGEPAFVNLVVDRAGLVPGTYTDEFVVVAGDLRKTVKVRVEVPEIDGDWSGYAAIRRVNGKEISLGKVDLYLGLFRPGGAVGGGLSSLRAIINRERSLLFPRDVALSGSFYAEHRFTLNANFEVPRGDRNAPPFATFSNNTNNPTSEIGFGDADLNGDGKLDNSNPFPFNLRREISLIGVRINSDRITGQYVESVQKLLPGDEKIYIEGEFELERKSFQPTLTGLFNRTVTTNVVIGGGGAFSFSSTQEITNQFVVEGVSGDVNLDFAGARDLELTLTSPATNSISLLKTNGFRGLFSFASTNFNGEGARGNWMLTVSWAGGSERGNLQAWSLRLQGTPVYEIRAVAAVTGPGSPLPLAGAEVRLTGHGAEARQTTATNGSFTFTNLTENDYVLFVSKPGYAELRTNIYLFTANVDLGAILLQRLQPDQSVLEVVPSLGFEPLHVRLTPLLSAADRAALGPITAWQWDFGDGRQFTGDAETGATVVHDYLAGFRSVAVNVVGANGNRLLTNQLHVQAALPRNRPVNLQRLSFIGSATSGALVSTVTTKTVDIIQNGVTNSYPVMTVSNAAESDRFLRHPGSGPSLIPTVGGFVFGTEPISASYPPTIPGGAPSVLRFHVGRIQPLP